MFILTFAVIGLFVFFYIRGVDNLKILATLAVTLPLLYGWFWLIMTVIEKYFPTWIMPIDYSYRYWWVGLVIWGLVAVFMIFLFGVAVPYVWFGDDFFKALFF